MKTIDLYVTVPDLTEDKEETILDSTTLEVVSITTNIPIKYFIERLNLKSITDQYKTLKYLNKHYEVKTSDVRKLIADYVK